MLALKAFCKALVGRLIGEYSPYYIYKCPLVRATDSPLLKHGFEVRPINCVQLSATDALQSQASYLGSEALAYGCFMDRQLVGVCFYWFGERYKSRGFWQLQPGEAKLVQIIVLPNARGRGVASVLIRASAEAMAEAGFTALYARIWHSNRPSLRAFEKAGWLRTAFILEVNPFRAKKPWRIQWMLDGR